MGFTFSGHWVRSCPAKGCGIYLGTLVSTTGGCPSKHSVCESRMWEPLIAKHPVIGRKSSCKSGVKACVNAPLRGQLDSPFGSFRGYHPPGRESLKVNWRGLARPHMPIQACVNTGNDNMRCQNLMEIVLVRHISHVGGQRVELIDD